VEGMTKWLVCLLVFILLFVFVFFKSNALEVHHEEDGKGGYYTTEYTLHWDRFFNYIKNIPNAVRGGTSKK
jgi:hypothetical protein